VYTSFESRMPRTSPSTLSSSSRERIEREIEAHIEELLLRLLQVIAQRFEVLVCRIEQRIAHQALRFRAPKSGSVLRPLSSGSCGAPLRIDRMDEDGNIEDLIEVDDRREPAVGKEAWVGNGIEGSRDFLAELDIREPTLALQARWCLQARASLRIDILRQHRRDLRLLSSFPVQEIKECHSLC
jgi:hypothetical protein